MCSVCGYRMAQMLLSVRKWTCPACGMYHDLDINAANNLRQVAESSMGSRPSIPA
ncbi:zinc ribbon domain-containing protein [Sulfobacillus thermosulfidooxidans]|uniref:zinc ribbon domain-containing protein n=1 Tax=Sulfobacillus thermosulfidooxidans TaxID=28034 RepID=UPI00241FABAD|nr:zinc ribbon domain-containing protein [Sulfobacillus thermosulfidooxidans]